MTTEQPSFARLHALWLQHLNDLVAAGVPREAAVETMLGVAITAKMSADDPQETVTMLRDLARHVEDNAEQMQRNAAIARAERRAH
jgi:sugar (pentulose or hexulose) kinase